MPDKKFGPAEDEENSRIPRYFLVILQKAFKKKTCNKKDVLLENSVNLREKNYE